MAGAHAVCGHRGTPKSKLTKPTFLPPPPSTFSPKPFTSRCHLVCTTVAHALQKNIVFSPLSNEERGKKKKKNNILTLFLPALFCRPWRPLPFPLLLLSVVFSSGCGGRVVLKHAEELIPESVRHLSELGDRISLLPTMLCERTDNDAKGSLSCTPWETKVV